MVRMTASEAFVETLAAQGVTDVFGIVGDTELTQHRQSLRRERFVEFDDVHIADFETELFHQL